MQTAHRLLVLGVLAIAASGCTSRSFEWREEVRLASGESFFLQRSHSSYTRAISMRLELPEAYASVVWEGDQWPISLDRIDGRWWVVIPVQGYGACAAYDFPPEGLVAFSFDGSAWLLGPVTPVLDQMTANLGRPRLDEGHYDGISFGWDKKHQGGAAMRLTDWIEPYLRQNDACIKIRPPYDPAREASLAAFAALAPADRAPVVESVERDLPPIEKAEHDRLRELWTGAGFLQDCSGIVSDIDTLYAWESNGSSLMSGKRIDFSGSGASAGRSAYVPRPPDLQVVTCDPGTTFAVLRSDGGQRLGIVEYSNEAVPVAVWSYRLAGLDDWFGNEWGMPVDLTDRGDSFAVTLVDEWATTRVRLALPKDSVPTGVATPLTAGPP